jgi:hypothetical protein
MAIIDGIGVVIAVAGGGAIGAFLTSAYHERIRNQHRAYEKEMAEHRDLYAALAMRRRLKPGSSSEDENNPVW